MLRVVSRMKGSAPYYCQDLQRQEELKILGSKIVFLLKDGKANGLTGIERSRLQMTPHDAQAKWEHAERAANDRTGDDCGELIKTIIWFMNHQQPPL